MNPENQVTMDHKHQVQVEIAKPHSSDRIVEIKDTSYVESVSEPQQQQQKPKGRGIGDLVTSVKMGQTNNNLLVQTTQKNIPLEK